jgi:hypothetical protein
MSCRLEKFETILPTSKRPTGSNDWPAPAHVVHTLCRSKHGLVLVLVARAGVFVEDDFDRSVQMLTSPGVLTSVGCRESVFLTSEFINVVHIDILAIPLILGVDAGDALIDGSPGEPLFFLIREEDDDPTHADAGSSRRDVFEAPAHEFVGLCIGLEAFGRAVSDLTACVAEFGRLISAARTGCVHVSFDSSLDDVLAKRRAMCSRGDVVVES